MNYSERQVEILSRWQTTDENILIGAVAGSGKTTTLLELLRYCEYKTLFLAFNKSIQQEIESKINERGLTQGKAMTLHSLGLLAIKNAVRYTLNNNKNWDLIKRLQDANKRTFNKLRWEDRVKLSYTIMDMNDVSRMFLTNDLDAIRDCFVTMDKNIYEDDSIDLQDLWTQFIHLREESYNGTTIEIDFSDMIYLPVIKELDIPIDPYYLMIDEAQDLNLCQHKLISKLLSQGTVKKWIAVGDRNQAIYGFSGAFASSFDLFLEKGNVVELPLDICYRCSTDIIDSANEVYDVMEYSGIEPGIVGNTSDVNSIKENSMIVCRNSVPLIDLYFKLLSYSKPCYIKGDDILTSILRFLKPYGKHTVLSARMEMLSKLAVMSENKTDAGKMEYFIFRNNFQNFKRVSEHLAQEYEMIDSVINKLKSMFVDKENAIMLCTIHKSKGLETDVVYILNEDLIPSRFAKSKEQLIQETNLKYVARTRAKKEMWFLDYNVNED